MLKSILQSIFRIFNYELIKRKTLANLRDLSGTSVLKDGNTMINSMHRLKANRFNPCLIIDIGAAKGKWTEKAQLVWPDSEYLLVEPLKEQLEQISQSLISSDKVKIIEAVAGAEPGNVSFNISPDLDGSGIYGVSENIRNVKVIKLDDKTVTAKEGILLKLDTHGYEIPIFEGAIETLKKTEVVIVEVYGFYVSPTAVLFHEISDYLLSKGFRLFDIVDIMRRDSDSAFWQADAIYVRESGEIFKSNFFKE
jgi:FkbM family methyltransferase